MTPSLNLFWQTDGSRGDFEFVVVDRWKIAECKGLLSLSLCNTHTALAHQQWAAFLKGPLSASDLAPVMIVTHAHTLLALPSLGALCASPIFRCFVLSQLFQPGARIVLPDSLLAERQPSAVLIGPQSRGREGRRCEWGTNTERGC